MKKIVSMSIVLVPPTMSIRDRRLMLMVLFECRVRRCRGGFVIVSTGLDPDLAAVAVLPARSRSARHRSDARYILAKESVEYPWATARSGPAKLF